MGFVLPAASVLITMAVHHFVADSGHFIPKVLTLQNADVIIKKKNNAYYFRERKNKRMRKSKITAAILSAVLLSVFLTACGSGGNPTTDTTETNASSNTAQTDFSSLGTDYVIELPVFGMTKWTASYGTEISNSDFTADESGRVIKSVMHIEDETFDNIWTYDEKGLPSKDEPVYSYDENGYLTQMGDRTYENDEHGLPVSEFYKNEEDKTIAYQYDAAGRVASAEVISSDGKLKTTYAFSYHDAGIPIQYEENVYGSGLDENIDTLSKTFIVTSEFNPFGLLTKRTHTQTFSSHDDSDSFTETAEYDVVAFYRLNAAGDERLNAPDTFAGFAEAAGIPTPDTVLKAIAAADGNGSYRYRLGGANADPIDLFNIFIHAFSPQNNAFPSIQTPLRSVCEDSNFLFFAYAGVLKALGYSVEFSADGQAEVKDASGTVLLHLEKILDGSEYVMEIRFQ